MIIRSAEFLKSAANSSHYPPENLPEIAFAGRSNAGKSSAINTLLNRKRLVKTSSTPGCTQLINFFVINEQLMFVDLPGYGYARAPVAERKKWGPMIENYLSKRQNLKGVVIVMDVRRRIGQEEINLMHWLDHYRIARVLVLTKSDKLSKTRQKKQLQINAKELGIDGQEPVLFSSKTRQGLAMVWHRIERLIDENTRSKP